MKLSELSPAGVLALMVVLSTLPPTSALPTQPRDSQSSAGSSTPFVSKIDEAISTDTQAISTVNLSTQPGGAVVWLRAIPKRTENDSPPYSWNKRALPCVGKDCMINNGTSTEVGCTEDSGSCEDAEYRAQISAGLRGDLFCDDPKCRIVCAARFCLPAIVPIDGQGSSGPPVRNGQHERDGHDRRNARDKRDQYDDQNMSKDRDSQDEEDIRDEEEFKHYAENHERPNYSDPQVATTFKSPFVIRDGKLYHDSGYFSTTAGVPFQLFKPSLKVSPIDSGFAINASSLTWKNEAFVKGEASFCRMPKDMIYIVFTGKPDWYCKDVELEVLGQPNQGG